MEVKFSIHLNRRVFVIEYLTGKTVIKTGTTGLAALQIGGVTLHRWSGYGDGRYAREELLTKVQDDDHFVVHKQNIISTDCLIIDEISMMSLKLFEDLEFLCRHIKDSEKYFGGMQVIGVGDFYQLPPVPDHNTQDSGEFCFRSPLFHLVFPHTMILTEVVRQQEIDFIKAIHETSIGSCSTETRQLLHRLSRKLPPGETPIRLCGRRFDCEIHNATKLMELDGDLFTYKAISEGKSNEMNKFVVPEVLYLKIGCPVLLVKNLSDKLVNGLRGMVRQCQADSVIVEFMGNEISGPQVATIKRETFSVFNRKECKNVATRHQLPLLLAYSITIHKAQGMTLDRVEVDASNIFAPGQLGVAIGRARNKKGLRVLGFNSSHLIQVSPDVVKFYSHVPTAYSHTLECCKYDVGTINELMVDFEIVVTSEEESEFSDTEVYELDHLFYSDPNQRPENIPGSSEIENEAGQEIELPFEFSKVTDLTSEVPQTDKQANVIQLLTELTQNASEFKKCVSIIYKDIDEIIMKNCGNTTVSKTEARNWTSFYTDIYTYSTSEKYTMRIRNFLQRYPTELEFDAFGKIMDKLVEIILEIKTSHITENTVPSASAIPVSDAGKGQLRYIGGRCIAKSKYHNMKTAKNNLYKPKHRQKVNEAFLKVRFLDFLSARSIDSVDIKYKCTLKETERKQNLSRGLTHITDDCYHFFIRLNEVRMKHQTEYNLYVHGGDALNASKEEALKHKELKKLWDMMVLTYLKADTIVEGSTEHCFNGLFDDVVSRFLKIEDNQFRKDCLRKFGQKKTDSLRKKVVSEKSSTENIQKERSVSKESRKRNNEKTIKTGPPMKSKRGRGRGWGKRGMGRGRKNETTTYCGYCQKEYVDGDAWVQCDKCDEWFDCHCQNISEEEFERLGHEAAPWFCFSCRQK